MMITKNKLMLGLLAVMLLSFSPVMAAFTPVYLPDSSLWDGARMYAKDGVNAYVEYAVYERSQGNPFTNSDVGDGAYIYAYEVQNLGRDLLPITFFMLLGGDPSNANGIGSIQMPLTIKPSNDGSSFVWNFDNVIFSADNRSAFMVFSSDSGPIAGAFRLGTLHEGGDKPPVIDTGDATTPEPATMALLAAGAFLIRRKNKN